MQGRLYRIARGTEKTYRIARGKIKKIESICKEAVYRIARGK
jgi:hypothetical protein